VNIASFDDLLRAAGDQEEPQRLLFVFAAAGIADDATPAQRERFETGRGGTLTPSMCVDKLLHEVATFEALLEESRQFDQAWDIVFVAALSGAGGAPPTTEQAGTALQRMVDSIKSGRIGGFIPFDARGQAVQFG